MKKIILLFSLSLLISGCTLVPKPTMPQNDNQNTNTVVETNTNQLIGGQKDEHGCLIPAGYSWCEAKQKCLRTWEEECATTNTNTVVDDTSAWQTYTNKEYGFEINYPSNFKNTTDKNYLFSLVPSNINEYKENVAPPIIHMEYYKGNNELLSLTDSKKIVINNLEATQGKLDGIPYLMATYIPYNAGYIKVTWPFINMESDTFSKILSTFKFIN